VDLAGPNGECSTDEDVGDDDDDDDSFWSSIPLEGVGVREEPAAVDTDDEWAEDADLLAQVALLEGAILGQPRV
jgi:hypothetical protein